MRNFILLASLIATASVVNMNAALADSNSVKHLECHISKALTSSASPANILKVIVNLEDGTKTVINNVKVQDALNTAIANSLKMAQIVKWNSQQVSISLDFNNVYIKDVASYTCN